MALSVAVADVTVYYDGLGPGSYQSIALTAGLEYWETSETEQFHWSRTYQHQWTDESTSEQYSSFCIQLWQGIDPGFTYDFEVVSLSLAPDSSTYPGPMGELRAAMLEDLYMRWINPMTGGIPSNTDPDVEIAQATAFQLLVYEITHENFDIGSDTDLDMVKDQMSFDVGAFQWHDESSVVDLAQALELMYDSLGFGGWLTTDALEGWVNSDAQDQVVFVPAPGIIPAVLGFGLIGLRRRRR